MKQQSYIPENLIARDKYLEMVQPFIGKNIIKVFTGQRRVGKSYLMFLVMEHIKEKYPKCNIIYVNKELDEFKPISTGAMLQKWLKKYLKKSGGNFLFIDEIQDIEGFEQALRSLLAEKKWDIWCTGSNASLFSADIAGKLSGRYIEIPVMGLVYKEFLQFHNLRNSAASLNKYLRYGGLPFLKNLELEDEQVYEYLKGVYATVIYKDIINRYNIRNTNFLEKLLYFTADNVGSLLSAKKISDYLKSQQISIPVNLILEYLKFISNSMLLLHVSRSDLQGKRIFEIGEKYYYNDLGIRNTIIGYKMNDIGKIIENAVLLHLLANRYKVFTGNEKSKEIDFIAIRGNQKIYIQVCYLLATRETYQREFGNLMLIKDNYPKYVVSMDTIKFDNDEGIIHWRLADFLITNI